MIQLFNTGKTLRGAARECVDYQAKHAKVPESAEDLFEHYQQFAPQMIADPFAAEGGVLRLSQRTDEEGAIWLQVWSVGPDGDWDGGKPIDSADPTLDGDLGAEMRIGKWAFNWLADDTMTMHLDGKRLSHYLAAQGPEYPGAINPHQTLDWGPVVDGLCMAVKLVPEKDSYTLGEKIGLEFHVRNVSRHPITIAGLSWRQDGGPDSFMIRNEHGENLEVSHSWFSGITPIQRETLKTGRVAVFKSSALAFLAQGMKHPGHPVGHTVVTTPGRHMLQYELSFPDGGSSGPDGIPRPIDWQGTLKTGVKVVVVEQANDPPKEAADREKEEAANAAAEAMKSARIVDSESRQRFLAVERFARLPQSEQAKRLPEFYRNLDSRALNPVVEWILSSYPHDILKGHQENDPFDGTTALWAGQLAGAADTLSPEQVADQLGLRLGVAARARALQVLRNHADATAALIGEDLATADKAAVERAGMAIDSLELRSFRDELLDLWLADGELSEAAWRTLVMLGGPGIVKPLLERVARDPGFLVRCSGLFPGPLAGKPALPQLVNLLDSPDAEIRYHAAYALQECRDPALAPWAVRLADEKEARFRFLAAHWIRMLPEDAFRAVRGVLLALLRDDDDEVRFYALKSFAEQQDLAAGPVILKLLRGEPPAEQHKVWVMQAMSTLCGNTWGYHMHNWGPDKPGNQKAIERLEGWLKQQGKNQPNDPDGLEFLEGIPEFRELSLRMTEAQLPGIIRRHSLAATRDGSGNYHLYTRNGENVIVMFRGGECTGIQRMRPDPDTAASLLVSRHERLSECWRLYTEACAFLCDQQGDRAEAARRFTMAARSAPVSETGFRARELAVLLVKMADEPRPRAGREAPGDQHGDISLEVELEDLFFDLRNLAFRPALSGKWSLLGPASVSLRKGQGNPAARLRDLAGDEAIRGLIVPRLLAMLDDRRPTRSWSGDLNGGHVLRHCDVALEILADLAGVLRPDGRSDFDSRTSRDDYLATADEQTRRKIIARVSACWADERVNRR